MSGPIDTCKLEGAFNLLHPLLRCSMLRYGYRRPTLVQEKAIPVIIRGYNALVVAPTGSGKTEAAIFPIISHIVGGVHSGLYAIYITPLRSLNRDIFLRMAKLASSVGVRFEVRHGDSSESEKKRFLSNPPHIAVMTPESFYFLLSIEKFRRALGRVKYFVIDEVHELVSSKRGAELSLALERAVRFYLSGRPSIIALSATVANPEDVLRLLFRGRLVFRVEIPEGRKYNLSVVTYPECKDCSDIEERAKTILSISSKARSVLVFTNTRDTAELLAAFLKKLSASPNRIEVHHSSLSREHRVLVEQHFKKGLINVVVATSSLEMGIDIGHVDLVVQLSSPRQAVKLAQRAGRAGHRYDGLAWGVIVASRNVFDILESAVLAARTVRGNFEEGILPRKPYDALLHQIAGFVVERPGLHLRDIYSVVTASGFYDDLDYDEFLSLIGFAESIGLLKVDGNGRVYPGWRTKRYYYSTTMIPDTRQYYVYDVTSGKKIGVLDEEFVVSLDKGDKFVLAGRVWEVIGFSEKGVEVRESQENVLVPPSWEGDLIPVEYKVAREVASIFRRFLSEGCRVLDAYNLEGEARRYVCRKLEDYLRTLNILPSDRCIVIEHYGDTFVAYTFLGSRGNKSLELIISEYIAESLGVNVVTASTPYAIIVRFPRSVEPLLLEKILKSLALLDQSEIKSIYMKAVRNSRVYHWLLYRVALRSGAIDVKNSEFDLLRVRSIVSKLADTPLGIEAFKEFEARKADLDKALMLIDEVRGGRRCIKSISLKSVSPLTMDVVSEARFTDRIVRERLTATMLAEVVRRRVESKEVCLVCMYCGYSWKKRIGDLPREKIVCPNCGAAMIYSSIHEENCKTVLLLVKRKATKLSRDDIRRLREAYSVASLVNDYGRYAIEALSVRGVGLQTARKVLQKVRLFGEEAFYKALVEAEINYVKHVAPKLSRISKTRC